MGCWLMGLSTSACRRRLLVEDTFNTSVALFDVPFYSSGKHEIGIALYEDLPTNEYTRGDTYWRDYFQIIELPQRWVMKGHNSLSFTFRS